MCMRWAEWDMMILSSEGGIVELFEDTHPGCFFSRRKDRSLLCSIDPNHIH